MLVVQKDEEIQATLLRTNAEGEKAAQQFMQSEQFSDLQFIQFTLTCEGITRVWFNKDGKYLNIKMKIS